MSGKQVSPDGHAEPRAADRRDEILAAAGAAIEELGPDAQTGQIAERGGLARPNLYRYFASKHDLDRALALRAYNELRRAVADRLGSAGRPRDVVRAPIEAQVDWAEQHPNLYRFLVGRGIQLATHGTWPAARGDVAAELATAVARYLPGFSDDPDAAEAALVGIMGLVDASILRWLDRRNEDRNALIDRLTAQCWLLVDRHLHEHGIHVDPTKPMQSSSGGASTTDAGGRLAT